jgi:pimeloyl-ACP methyl ester carboxylesterase
MATTPTAGTKTPLLLIHGAWLSARSWENFADYFGTRGFTVSAPEWPRKEGDVEQLREDADELAGLGLDEIVDHYETLIRKLDQAPVLIGHSFGGLIVELLLDRGLGRAGVALSPAPLKGILVLPFSSLKAAAPALAHPSRWHGVVPLTLEEFTYGFVNTFTPEEAEKAYERYAVPETGEILYEAGFANFHLHPPTEVHFKSGERAPLLIVGAEEDHTVPASLAKKQYKSTKTRRRRPTTTIERCGLPANSTRRRLGRSRRRDRQLAQRSARGVEGRRGARRTTGRLIPGGPAAGRVSEATARLLPGAAGRPASPPPSPTR